MIKNFTNFSILIVLILAIGCKKADHKIETYFGGKIIHPKSNHIILFLDDRVIDTLFLDAQNNFFTKLDITTGNLFYFTHGYENQYVYLQPKDSLLLRLNTWDFDESLVFSGKGAERNNMLIDSFLDEESEENQRYDFNKLSSDKFKEKIDSIIENRLLLFNEFVTNHPLESEDFKKVLKVSMIYPLYSSMEKFPILHAKFTENESLPEVNKSFYEFRERVTINDDSLFYFPPYSKYVRNYLYNETYSLGYLPMKKNYSAQFTSDLLTTINKKISEKTIKNVFLKQTVVSHFYNKSSCDFNQEPFAKYFELSSDENDKIEVKKLIDDAKAITINQKLENFSVSDYLHKEKLIHEVIAGKNACLFFWNPAYVSESYLVSRINFLSKSYPNIVFIPIKIDGNKELRVENLDIKNQFYITDDSKANDFLTCKMPRSVLVDKNGIVVNGYASISSININAFLEKLNHSK